MDPIEKEEMTWFALWAGRILAFFILMAICWSIVLGLLWLTVRMWTLTRALLAISILA